MIINTAFKRWDNELTTPEERTLAQAQNKAADWPDWFNEKPNAGKWLRFAFAADKNAAALMIAAFFVSWVAESKSYAEYSARSWSILSRETPKPFTI
jgi:hypothetical protein